jgi:hypothetical protein
VGRRVKAVGRAYPVAAYAGGYAHTAVLYREALHNGVPDDFVPSRQYAQNGFQAQFRAGRDDPGGDVIVAQVFPAVETSAMRSFSVSLVRRLGLSQTFQIAFFAMITP